MIGAVGWWGTGEPAAVAAALAGGVLPDVDHVVDYSYFYWQREHRLILPLHAYEFAMLGAGGIAVLSYFIHLLADQAENRTRILGYFLLFRAWNHFQIERLSTVPEDAMRGRMGDINSLKKLLTRWQK